MINIARLLPVILLVACSHPAIQESDTSGEIPGLDLYEQAMQSSALDLASSYQYVSIMLEHYLPAASKGIGIVTPQGQIDQSNAEEFTTIFTERLSSYSRAIEQRGHVDLSGTYKAKATSACRQVSSSAAFLITILEGGTTSITINQSGYTFMLGQQFEHDGEIMNFEYAGVVVESVLVFQDWLNTNIQYYGEMVGHVIWITPDAEVMRKAHLDRNESQEYWKNLSSCTITLQRQ